MKTILIALSILILSHEIIADNNFNTRFGIKSSNLINLKNQNLNNKYQNQKFNVPTLEKKQKFSADVVVELKPSRTLKLKKRLLAVSKFSEKKYKNKNFENVYLAASQIVSKRAEKKLFKALAENGAVKISSFIKNNNPSNNYYNFCFENFIIIQTESSVQAKTLAKKLKKLKYVRNADVSCLYHSSLWEPDDYYFNTTGAWGQTYNNLWGMQTNKMNAPAAWEKSKGENVIVAVLDSGVDINHPDISNNIWTNPGEIPNNNKDDDHNGFIDDVHGWRFVDRLSKYYKELGLEPPKSGPDVSDADGHGTHVAGIIAATTDNGIGISGVAPDAKIMPVCVLPGGTGTDFDIAKGIIYAVKNGANVLNMSFGSDWPNPPILKRAIKYAVKKGAVPVAAVGNDNFYATDYPAATEGVIAVSASDQNDNRAWFSNYGFGTDVAAPGGGTNYDDTYNILSLYSTEATSRTSEFSSLHNLVVDDDYLRIAGTSMACPQVSGAVALLLSLHPDWTVEEVRAALRQTADSKENDWSNETGYGRVNLDKLTKVSKSGAVRLIGSPKQSSDLINLSKLPARIKFKGTANSENFRSYKIEEGIGIAPTNWNLVYTGSRAKKNGKLAPTIKIESMKKNEVRCYRLTVLCADSTKLESRLWVEYEPLPPSFGKSKTNKIKTKRLPEDFRCIACDSKNNAYYVGTTYKNSKYILRWRKYSSDGKLISNKKLFKDKKLFPFNAVTDAQDNLIIVGNTPDLNSTDKWRRIIFIAKLDSNGNPLWINLDSELGEIIYLVITQGYSPPIVCIDNDNNIIISSPISTSGYPNIDFLMAKYDSDGNKIWANYQTLGKYASPAVLNIDSENNIYSVGYCWTNNNFAEMFITKHNSDGAALWAHIPGTNMIPYGMSLLPDSGLLIMGKTDVAQHGLVPPPFGGDFSFIAKFNNDGEIVTANNLALNENMWPQSNSLILEDGSIIISGEYTRKYQNSGLFCARLSQEGKMLKLDIYTMKRVAEPYSHYIALNSKGDLWMLLSGDNFEGYQARLPEFVYE